jgi:hypothetical protein
VVGDLTRTFEAAAACLSDWCGPVRTVLGAAAAVDLLQQTHGMVDGLSLRALNAFSSASRIRQRQAALDAELVALQSGGAAAGGAAADPRDLDRVLGEIAAVSARAARYDAFLRTVLAPLWDALTPEERTGQPDSGLPRQTALLRAVHDLIAFAVLGERYFMIAAATKAARIDTYPAEAELLARAADEAAGAAADSEAGPPVSTVVDDVFFIVGKSVRRALASRSADHLCVALHNASDALERVLAEVRCRYRCSAALTLRAA